MECFLNMMSDVRGIDLAAHPRYMYLRNHACAQVVAEYLKDDSASAIGVIRGGEKAGEVSLFCPICLGYLLG